MTFVWIVENDRFFIDELKPLLEHELGAEVITISSEEEFKSKYEALAETYPPAVVIMDVWLSWTTPSVSPSSPPISCRAPQRAGIRCRSLLLLFGPTAQVPVVFYSMLPKSDISPCTDMFLTKRSGHRALLAHLRDLLGITLIN